MPNRKALIITNSIYQLFSAVHMRRSLLAGTDTDLIVTDVTPKLQQTIPRICETQLFQRIIGAKTKEFNQKYAPAKGEALSEGFQDIASRLRWMLNEELDDYDAVYFSNFDPFTRLLACWFYGSPCEFICYEDGFSSYVIDFLREGRAPVNSHPEGKKIREKVKYFLLYEPRLAMRGDSLANRPLPKIDRNDTALKEALNHIFAYRAAEIPGDFIFLEQSFRAEGIRSNDIELMKECREAVGPGRFVVKPHPRNPENLPFQLGLTRQYPDESPWELFLLNENPENRIILTVCSNAALTGTIVFGMDLPTVMLYRLFEGKVLWKEDDVLKRYLRKFQKQFAGEHYYVPETVYELRSVLHYLGGEQNGK